MEKKSMRVVRELFYLKQRDYITPHYIRVTLEGDQVAAYQEAVVGANNKVFIAPDGVDRIYWPSSEEVVQDAHLEAIRRTYTHKGVDVEKNEMYVDFVAHGSEGPASRWAMEAPIGSPIGVAMKITGKALVPQFKRYFLIGDATAIPVLGAILESLPPDAEAFVLIEVQTPEDKQTFKSSAKIEVQWLVNATPGQNSDLGTVALERIKNDGTENSFAYIACEYEGVRFLRTQLRQELGWGTDRFYAYSYWKFGTAESVSESERQSERDRML